MYRITWYAPLFSSLWLMDLRRQHGREVTVPTLKQRSRIQVLMLWGPLREKPWKLFWPAKPFVANRYFKTQRCIRLKCLVWREPLFVLRRCAQKKLWSHKVEDSATAFRARKLLGTSRNLPLTTKLNLFIGRLEFNSSVMLVTSQLLCLAPVGISLFQYKCHACELFNHYKQQHIWTFFEL